MARRVGTEPIEGAASRISSELRLAFPISEQRLEQDNEWCVVRQDGEWRKIRFHDYARVYEIPRLYEYLFADLLKCSSPRIVRELLERELQCASVDPGGLRVLDLGAGNGLMGEELVDLGAQRIVGVDIIPQAAAAAERDRPGVYDKYFVLDMTKLNEPEGEELARLEFNCLTCIAALGFGDIPPEAFIQAYNLVKTGGWIAFNIKEDFLQDARSGFARLIRRMAEDGSMAIRVNHRYRHRLATSGEPIFYVALIASKNCDFERTR
jgi:predicted TPR repeat methyltransferase